MASSLINLEKSALVFRKNILVQRTEELAYILEVSVMDKHEKYLGLPTAIGKLKWKVFEGIKECFWKKINGWATKKLSQAGRVVLIKSTQDLLAAGLLWCIGNSESVLILGVPWPPGPISFHVISKPKSLQESTKVAKLLNEARWNESLVREEFSLIDSECILAIPLLNTRG
ncbi:UNVERIFIED_CONTAM: hypothetical protein Scaly_1655000 [Sesamum calycinum]|uniref:Reverse transcriptase n=1 Tax=Sesamum calycinum TaxID=2727403 RepID=A0AAW2NU39_9LAMI